MPIKKHEDEPAEAAPEAAPEEATEAADAGNDAAEAAPAEPEGPTTQAQHGTAP